MSMPRSWIVSLTELFIGITSPCHRRQALEGGSEPKRKSAPLRSKGCGTRNALGGLEFGPPASSLLSSEECADRVGYRSDKRHGVNHFSETFRAATSRSGAEEVRHRIVPGSRKLRPRRTPATSDVVDSEEKPEQAKSPGPPRTLSMAEPCADG